MYSEINNVRYSLNEEIFSEKPIIKLGMYENELELFYKGVKSPKDNLVAINEDKVIVDGNNVARHPNISPTIANLISMKKALEEKGISTKRIKIENQTRFAIREGGRTVGAGVVSKIIK